MVDASGAVRDGRRSRRLTQADLAAAAGVARSTLQRIEAGLPVSDDTARAACAALGIDAAALSWPVEAATGSGFAPATDLASPAVATVPDLDGWPLRLVAWVEDAVGAVASRQPPRWAVPVSMMWSFIFAVRLSGVFMAFPAHRLTPEWSASALTAACIACMASDAVMVVHAMRPGQRGGRVVAGLLGAFLCVSCSVAAYVIGRHGPIEDFAGVARTATSFLAAVSASLALATLVSLMVDPALPRVVRRAQGPGPEAMLRDHVAFHVAAFRGRAARGDWSDGDRGAMLCGGLVSLNGLALLSAPPGSGLAMAGSGGLRVVATVACCIACALIARVMASSLSGSVRRVAGATGVVLLIGVGICVVLSWWMFAQELAGPHDVWVEGVTPLSLAGAVTFALCMPYWFATVYAIRQGRRAAAT